MRFTNRRNLTFAWLLGVAAFAAYAGFSFLERQAVEADMLELLPRTQFGVLADRAVEVSQSQLRSSFVVLIGHPSDATAGAAAQAFLRSLGDHPLIAGIDTQIDSGRLNEVVRFYYPRRARLLTGSQIESIESDGGAALYRLALASAFSFITAPSGAALLEDPFSLLPSALAELDSSGVRLSVENGLVRARRDGREYVVLAMQTAAGGLSMDDQAGLVDDLGAARRAAESVDGDVEVFWSGFLFYANAGTQSAKSEVSIIAGVSLAGIVLLIFAAFGSLRPLWLALLSILCGCIVAIGATVLIFDEIHLFTLVFGASLIGVSVDYTFHFVSERVFGTQGDSPTRSLRKIFPGISLGLLTSIGAYMSLATAPFPGLRQLAVFSTAGLLGAFVTLILTASGANYGKPTSLSRWLFGACDRAQRAWGNLTRARAAAVVIVPAALCGMFLPFIAVDDDVAILQARPPELLAEEERVAQALGVRPSEAFFLVTASDVEQLLQREEALRERLDAAVERGALRGYQALSTFVPSSVRQQRSLRAYDGLLESHAGELLSQLGLEEARVDALTARLSAAGRSPLSLEDWLADPSSLPWRGLWLGDDAAGSVGSMIRLIGAGDPSELAADLQADSDISLVDQRESLSHIFETYRLRVSVLLVGAYAALFLLLSMRYGWRTSIAVVAPPVVAGMCAIAGLAVLGISVNLFSVLALIIVLGTGIDYTLFLAESKEAAGTTMLAIMLSALTTILSFGMLSLSETFAIRSFGLTVLVGIACAVALAPTVVAAARER